MNYKKRKKRLFFFGDSITEQGVKYGGYINLLQRFLKELAIDEEYELAGAGVSGDKIYDLYLRLEGDVLAKGPDIVVIFIGINDIWHKFTKLTGTRIDAFESFYIAIVEKLLSVGIKVVLCTPAVIGEEPSFATKEDEEIEVYSDVIRNLASKYDLPLVDIRKAFVECNKVNNVENREQGILTTDKVHLNCQGNQLVAEEMWKVLKDVKLK
jgi:lysophospholipase L1-like esterase